MELFEKIVEIQFLYFTKLLAVSQFSSNLYKNIGEGISKDRISIGKRIMKKIHMVSSKQKVKKKMYNINVIVLMNISPKPKPFTYFILKIYRYKYDKQVALYFECLSV